MTQRLIGLICCSAGLMIAAPAQPQAVVHTRFRPMVIPQSQTASVVFEARVSGMPTAVRLALQSGGSPIALLDNGTAPDATAADGIFTAAVPAADALFGFASDDVNRNFVGFLRLYQGTTQTTQLNIFIDVLTPDIPAVTITNVSAAVQYSEHLVNVVRPAFFTDFDEAALSGAFYAAFFDNYDFLNIIYEISHPSNRNHFIIRNDVAGIGSPMRNLSAGWGSAGRLLGRTVFPIPTFFDGASPGYLHELGHQWINYLAVPALASTVPHWPISDLASDIMGWGTGLYTQGLAFDYDLVPSGSGYQLVASSAPKVFSDLSLYLMGLAAPSEVTDHFVFDNQNQSPASGAVLAGPVTTVRIGDVIAAMGARSPTHTNARKNFRVATVLVSRDGLVSSDVMRLYDHFSARAELATLVPYSQGLAKGQASPFRLATRGRGRLDARIMHRVLVDASRDGGAWWFPQTGPFNPAASHQGKPLADFLRSRGHVVEELPRPTAITNALLEGRDIVIRVGNVGSYTAAEIAAYQSYVWGGGSLLLLADHAQPGAVDGLAQSLGLRFAGRTRGATALSQFATHAITNGVGSLSYTAGSGLLAYPTSAQILGLLSGSSYVDLNNDGVRNAGEPSAPAVLGVMPYGAGVIVFCGDVNLWESAPQTLLANLLAWFEGER